MKGKIFYEGKEFYFANLRSLTFQADGKVWILEKSTERELKFKPAPMGGYQGTGNYLKSWRKRHGHTQLNAAKILGVSPSFIGKIETGERNLPLGIFEVLQRDARTYGRG